MESLEELKRIAGNRAAEFVTSGMVVGLGSGSTARYATLRIGQLLREGTLHDIIAVPTSEETARLAEGESIPLTSLDQVAQIDVTLDGADEVDPELNVVKGQGGFLLREKIVAAATVREVYVVDESKLVDRLNTRSPIATEVIQFGWKQTRIALERLGASTVLRMTGDHPYITDEGNYILDCRFDPLTSPRELELKINAIPGVVENGLFIDRVFAVVVASRDGVKIIER